MRLYGQVWLFFQWKNKEEMYSRAHLLIEREYEKFKKDTPWVSSL